MSYENSTPLAPLKRANGYLVVIGLFILVVLFLPTVKSMITVWSGENGHYSHGFLLVFLLAYILSKEWKSKGYYFHVYPRFHTLVLLFTLSIIWLLTKLTHVQVANQITYVLIMATYLIGLFGYKGIANLLFPILMLLTTVPVWTVLSEPLQYPTAFAVDNMLGLTGYISFRDGYTIHIPEGMIEVSDGCSGLNNQIVAVTLSLLLAYFYRLRLFGMLVLTLFGSAVAFISNSIRIYIIILAGHYTQMQHSLLYDHEWLGWVVFSVCYTLFIFLFNRISQKNRSSEVDASQKLRAMAEKGSILTSIMTAILLLVAAAMGPVLFMGYQVLNSPNDKAIINLPNSIGEWRKYSNVTHVWNPVWSMPDVTKLERYENNNGSEIDFFLSYYTAQDQGREIVNSENSAFDRNKWSVVNNSIIRQVDKSGKEIELREIIINNASGKERIIWQWYIVGGIRIADDLHAKIQGLLAILKGRTDATVFILSTEIEHDISEARIYMGQFASIMIVEVEEIIDNL